MPPSKDNYVPPVFLSDQARDLNDRFYLILNNLVASYSGAKFKPDDFTIDDNTITNMNEYNKNMGQMQQLQSDYFTYRNSVVKNSEAMLTQFAEMDARVNALDAENASLKSRLADLGDSGRSAEGMLDDSQITRNQMFYGNIVLFIIMVAGGIFYYKKVYKASPATAAVAVATVTTAKATTPVKAKAKVLGKVKAPVKAEVKPEVKAEVKPEVKAS